MFKSFYDVNDSETGVIERDEKKLYEVQHLLLFFLKEQSYCSLW